MRAFRDGSEAVICGAVDEARVLGLVSTHVTVRPLEVWMELGVRRETGGLWVREWLPDTSMIWCGSPRF